MSKIQHRASKVSGLSDSVTSSIQTDIQVANRNTSNQTPAVMDVHITVDYVVVATIK